jgi:uncharacterized protein (TIGR02757 family)
MRKKRLAESILQLKEFLNDQVAIFNRPDFIPIDPISIPHRFTQKEDIEISGFLTATIAWGQRPVILKNATRLMQLMDDAPHDFILNAVSSDFKIFNPFVHRTFNGDDCIYFLQALQSIYKKQGGLETLFADALKKSEGDMAKAIHLARAAFFSFRLPGRTAKHFADPIRNSSAKRINMYLRWMVRNDKRGVDFGIWKKIKPSQLYCPLDVHSGRVARELGLLSRKQDDWKAVEELTGNLRLLDAIDPVKYDFALFGMGVGEIRNLE